MQPTITVIIATYNNETTIERALLSLKAQHYDDWEAIIINDASTDNTLTRIKAQCADDVRMSYHTLETNLGPAHARNIGLKHAQGTFITILDADDAYAPERLGHLLGFMQNHTLDMAADNLALYDAAIDNIVAYALPITHQMMPWTLEQHITSESTTALTRYSELKYMVRADFLKNHQIRYDARLRIGEDVLLYLHCLQCSAQAAISTEPHYHYTSPEGIVSRQHSGVSSTRYNAQQHVHIYHLFLAHYNEALNPEITHSINAACRRITLFDDYKNIVSDLKNGHVLKAIKQIIMRPKAVIYALHSVRKWRRRYDYTRRNTFYVK